MCRILAECALIPAWRESTSMPGRALHPMLDLPRGFVSMHRTEVGANGPQPRAGLMARRLYSPEICHLGTRVRIEVHGFYPLEAAV